MTSLKGDFKGAYDSAETWFDRLAMTVPSNSASNTYAWMSQLPAVREWIGARHIHNLESFGYALYNKTWEHTLGVKREDIEDDNIGLYTPLVAAQGESCKEHKDELGLSVIESNPICFDGQNFFDTDHPIDSNDTGSATYDNSLTLALTSANLNTAINTMTGFRGPSGRRLGKGRLTLMVPTALGSTARQIVNSELVANTAGTASISNPDKGIVDLFVNDDLTDATRWYLMYLGKVIKPFVFQSRRPWSFVAKDKISDEVVLVDDQFRLYADARYNVGVTFPFLALRSKP
jgi:phage major head subunit gpT-like protein